MRVTIVGDIGWSRLYHLGDEAMTEAAMQMLRARGVDDFVLVAGEPDVAARFYGADAVPRLGFEPGRGRWYYNRKLDELRSAIADGRLASDSFGPIVDAVASSDAAIIAGGGNINSRSLDQLYERVGFALIAKHFGVPLVASSQTIGPILESEDKSLVTEILDYATCFGARESTSHQLLIDLGGDPQRVIETVDDALMLEPSDDDRRVAEGVRTERPFVVASFIAPVVAAGPGDTAARLSIAEVLDGIAERHDVDVLLVPHEGAFAPEPRTGDQLAADRIIEASRSGRIRQTEMLTAGQAIALTAASVLSLSSRYHPTVFAPIAGVPTVALAPTYYSSIRMRGALKHVGLRSYALPTDAWVNGPLDAVVDDLLSRDEEYREHMRAVSADRREAQHRWWDAIVEVIRTRRWVAPQPMAEVPVFEPPVALRSEIDRAIRISDQLGIAQFLRELQGRQLDRVKGWHDAVRRDLAEVRQKLEVERSELAKEKRYSSRLREARDSARHERDNARTENTRLIAEISLMKNRKSVRIADAIGRAVAPFRSKR